MSSRLEKECLFCFWSLAGSYLKSAFNPASDRAFVNQPQPTRFMIVGMLARFDRGVGVGNPKRHPLACDQQLFFFKSHSHKSSRCSREFRVSC